MRTPAVIVGAWLLTLAHGYARAESSTMTNIATFVGMLSPVMIGVWVFLSQRWKAAQDLENDLRRKEHEAALKAAEEDRSIARSEAAEDRRLARQVAAQAHEAAISARIAVAAVKATLVETTAVSTAAIADTKEKLDHLAGAVKAQNVVAQQTGEVLASVHAFLNSGKTMTLKKNAEDARKKATDSGLKEDSDAAELAERDLADQLAKQLIADTQGGKGQEAGAAGIKLASEALAGAPQPKEEHAP